MTAPRRRWSVGIRTLLVVNLLSAALWWWRIDSVNWAAQRARFFADHCAIEVNNAEFPCQPLPRPPLGLWLFGEEGRRNIWVNDPAALDEARRMFPEAEVRYHHFECHESPGSLASFLPTH